jgi:hypothetical protein
MPAKSHGMSGTRLYILWKNMKGRCYRKSSTHYHRYGGRGIKVCEEWRNSFETFMKFALDNGYTDDLTIDRIDINEDYTPFNCRFIDGVTNVNLMNEHHINNKTGGQSEETRVKVKESNRENNRIRVRVTKGEESYEFRSIGEASEFLAEILKRKVKNVYSHAKQVLKGKCETISGWSISKCEQ